MNASKLRQQLENKAYWDYSDCALCWNAYKGCEEKCGNAKRVIKFKDVLEIFDGFVAELRGEAV